MSAPKRLLLGGCWLSLIALGCFAQHNELNLVGYQLLNEYLVNMVPPGNFESDLKALFLLNLDCTTREDPNLPAQYNNQAFLKALHQVTWLSIMPMREPECNSEELGHLQPFALNTRIHNYHPNPRESLNRLEKLIYVMVITHARACSRLYPEKFANLLMQIDRHINDAVLNFMAPWLDAAATSASTAAGTSSGTRETRNHIMSLLTREPLDYESYPEHAANFILQGEPASRGMVTMNYAQTLYRCKLFEPCSAYCNHFGPNLFESAEFDSKLFIEGSYSNLNLDDSSLVPFFQALARYRTCSAITKCKFFGGCVVSLLV